MSTIEMCPEVPNIEYTNPPAKKKSKNGKENCWELCLTEQFPVVSHSDRLHDKVICDIGSPHEGYIMETTLRKKKYDGKAVIRDQKETTIAKFSFHAGVASGNCKLYYPTGELYFSGKLKDGYRHGFGKEYDLKGNVVYSGFFKNGVRNDNIVKVENQPNLWIETNSKGKVVAMCHKNENGEDHGLCAFYENEKLYKIAQYKDGEELYPVYLFDNENSTMKFYKKGVLQYEGQYGQTSLWRFYREGAGEEYDSDGHTLKFSGFFHRNKYSGYGNWYIFGKRTCLHNWDRGIPISIKYYLIFICTLAIMIAPRYATPLSSPTEIIVSYIVLLVAIIVLCVILLLRCYDY